MPRLRLLGPVDLRDDSGRELRGLLGRPKRLAVLAYLAGNGPQAFHRRDRLLALFWPESTLDRARHGLRQVLYELRNHLGENVIIRRGADEIALNDEIVACDVSQLQSAITEGDLERAMELYRGDFLDGFFLSKAPDVERWIEQRRAEIHQRIVEVAWNLVGQRETQNDLTGAITAAHRAVALAPVDEVGVRRLLSLLRTHGSIGEALRVYDRLVRRLANEFGTTPSPETRALIREIRGAGADGQSDLIADESATDGAEPPAPTDRSSSVAVLPESLAVKGAVRGPRRPWEKAAATVAVGLALVTIVVSGVWESDSRDGGGAGSTLSDLRVAVFPALARAPDSEYLVHGVADLLHAALDGAGELRAVDPNALYAELRQRGVTGDVGPDDAHAVAEALGAGLFVLTRAVDVGGRLRITGSLYDATHGAEVYATFGAVDEPEELSQIVEEVAWGLVTAHPVGSGMRLEDVATIRPASYRALKAYLEGEAAVRRRDYPAAIDAFDRAIDEDSTFGLAWFRRGLFLTWIDAPAGVRSRGKRGFQGPAIASEAFRHGTGLSWPDSVLLLGWHAQLTGDPDRAEEHYSTLLAAYPEHVDALHFRAGVRAWYGWRHGRPRLATRQDFQKVLAIDPDHPLSNLWEAGLHVFEGGYFESLDLAGRPLPDHGVLSGAGRRAVWAFTVGDSLSHDAAMEELRDAAPGVIEWAVYMLSASRRLEGATRVATALLDPLRRPSREDSAFGLLLASRVEVARGRWQSAGGYLAALAVFAPELALAHRSLLAVGPSMEVPEAELRSLLAAVQDWSGDFPTTPSVAVGGPLYGLAIPPEFEPQMRSYLLGLLHARIGEGNAAREYANELLEAADVSDTLGLIGDAAREVQAMAALSDDEPDVALAALEHATLRGASSDYVRSFMYQRPLHPMLRAQSLVKMGRYEEAVGWYATVPSPVFPGEWRLATSHHQRAQILDRLGETAEAVEHYVKFADMWADADPAHHTLVAAARKRIAVLGQDR